MIKGKISFSLYGNQDKYNVGAIKNFHLCKKYLPDWEVNFFANTSMSNMEILTDLEKEGAVINITDNITISNRESTNFPMFWRFFTFFDNVPSISRDLDSRMTLRESDYIKRWEETDYSIFIIRDHPWHSLVPGGLVGMKNVGSEFKSYFEKYMINGATGYGADQDMLSDFVHKNYSNNIFSCVYGNENYIKRDDPDFFIGIQLDENETPLSPVAIKYLKEIGY